MTLGVVLALSACAPPEEILPGERFGPREAAEAVAAFDPEAPVPEEPLPQPPTRVPSRPYVVTGEPAAIALPAPRTNADWTHVGGNPNHQTVHPALGSDLTRVWSVDIGAPATRRVRSTAAPVVDGARVFTLSAFTEVQATSTAGAALWRRDLTPPTERAGEAAGGGLAVAGGRVYVATGYGRLHVLDATSGTEIWQQALGAVPSGPPTVAGDLVYITTRGAEALAIDTGTGRVLWRLDASESGAFTNAGPAPAVSGRTAIFPFGSGDVIATLRLSGVRLWATTLAGARPGVAFARVPDITADPVIAGDTVYVGTPTGRIAALDLATGERRWTASEGAVSHVIPVGGAVFAVSDQAELLRLRADDGSVVWSGSLPLFPEERVRRRRGTFAHFGPVLAGGRLIVVSSDGAMREFDPRSGAALRQTDLGSPASAGPVVAGGVLYVLTENGQLHAFR
jgi:outer membrane protein assembly factor BamB